MSMVEIKVPDIGDFKDVPIIQVFVKPGDSVKQEDPLIALESDKATMDVPSPSAGTVKDLKVKVGDRVSKGNLILLLDSAAEAKATPSGPSGGNGQSAATTQAAAPAPKAEARGDKQKQPEEERPKPGEGPEKTAGPPPAKPEPKAEAAARSAPTPTESEAFKRAHASPSVRKFARELGVDLSQVKGSGPKGRILQEDVQSFVKQAISGGAAPAGAPAGGGLNLLPWPQVDFTKFGPVEPKPLSRIKKIAGANLARNWVMIPHVTQFDEADITDLEALRVQLNKENEKAGIKI